MTEDLCSIVNFPDRARRKLGAGILGKPVLPRQHHVRIVDEDGRAMSPGTVGEIVKRSPATMLGYYRDPARTAEALRDGWLHTGDYGRRDADGFYYFVGRKKDVIKRGGENVSAAQVEAALASTRTWLGRGGGGARPDPPGGDQGLRAPAPRKAARHRHADRPLVPLRGSPGAICGAALPGVSAEPAPYR